MSHRNSLRFAFSLVEVVIATLLVGILMVASLDTVGGATKTWLVACKDQTAESLAFDLMSEILSQPYSDPDFSGPEDAEFGIEPGETTATRIDFDDLDDYDDWTATPPVQRDGTAIPGLAGWSRSVVVIKLADTSTTDYWFDHQTDEGMRRITVTVVDADGASTVLRSIRSRMGGGEQHFGFDTEVVTNLRVDMTAGGAGTLSGGVSLTNHADTN